MKKLTSLVLALALLLPMGAVFADAAVQQLSVTQAVELATKNSNQLRIYQKEVDLSEIAVDEARRNKNLVVDGTGPVSTSTILMRGGYNLEQAKQGNEMAEKNVVDYKKQLELKVKTDYFSYRAAVDKMEKAYLAYGYSNENLWVVHNKYLAGVATLLEDMQATTNKERARNERDAAIRSLDLARQQLCATLGLPLDTQLEAIDQLVVANPENQPLPDDVMSEALSNTLSIIQARGAAELAQLQFNIIKKNYQESTVAYEQAELNMESVFEKRYIAETNAKLNIYKLYNDMMNSYESAQTASAAATASEQAYIVTVVRYDAGLIPNADVLSSFASFKDAQISENQAKLAAATAMANYEIAVGK